MKKYLTILFAEIIVLIGFLVWFCLNFQQMAITELNIGISLCVLLIGAISTAVFLFFKKIRSDRKWLLFPLSVLFLGIILMIITLSANCCTGG